MDGLKKPQESSRDILQRELGALIPVALSISEQYGEDRAMCARRVIGVAMSCAGPLLDKQAPPPLTPHRWAARLLPPRGRRAAQGVTVGAGLAGAG